MIVWGDRNNYVFLSELFCDIIEYEEGCIIYVFLFLDWVE